MRLGAAPVIRLERPLAHVKTPGSSCRSEGNRGSTSATVDTNLHRTPAQICVGTRREVAVKPSHGTGHLGTGSNARATGDGPEMTDRSLHRTHEHGLGRTGVRGPFSPVRRSSRGAESAAFRRTRSRGTLPLPPQGGAQQAMVLSCASMAGQRHAGSARSQERTAQNGGTTIGKRSHASRTGLWGLGDDAG